MVVSTQGALLDDLKLVLLFLDIRVDIKILLALTECVCDTEWCLEVV